MPEFLRARLILLVIMCFAGPTFAFTPTDVLLPSDSSSSSPSIPSQSLPSAAHAMSGEGTTLATDQSADPSMLAPGPTTKSIMAGSSKPAVTPGVVDNGPTKIIKLSIADVNEKGFGPTVSGNRVSVSWATPPVWTDSMTAKVSSLLAIDPKDVPNSCTIDFVGRVMTDKGMYTFQLNPSSTATVPYDGKILFAVLNAKALCNSNITPNKAGILAQVGDKYLLPVDQLMCNKPVGNVIKITFSFDGKWDGNPYNSDTTPAFPLDRCHYSP